MTDIIKTAVFPAPRDKVWAFLTEKEKLGRWFHPATADLVEGQDYALVATGEDGSVQKQCWGTVLKMDRPSTLVTTFTVKPLGGKMTTVTWTLEEVAGGTLLTLRHAGIADAAGEAALGLMAALDVGWDKHLGALRTTSASG